MRARERCCVREKSMLIPALADGLRCHVRETHCAEGAVERKSSGNVLHYRGSGLPPLRNSKWRHTRYLYMCVLIPLYMCPHTSMYLYMCPYPSKQEAMKIQRSGTCCITFIYRACQLGCPLFRQPRFLQIVQSFTADDYCRLC